MTTGVQCSNLPRSPMQVTIPLLDTKETAVFSHDFGCLFAFFGGKILKYSRVLCGWRLAEFYFYNFVFIRVSTSLGAYESCQQWSQNTVVKYVPESIIVLAGGHLSRRMYAVVGSSTAITDAADMALIPSSLISSRWLIALAPSWAPSWHANIK